MATSSPFNVNRGFVRPTPVPVVDTRSQAQRDADNARNALTALNQAKRDDFIKQRVAAIEAEFTEAFPPKPTFKEIISGVTSEAEILKHAVTFANTKTYYDTDVRDILRERLPENQLSPLLKKWIKNVVSWEINPKNKGSKYYGFAPRGSSGAAYSVTFLGYGPTGEELVSVEPKYQPFHSVLSSPVAGIVPGKTIFLPQLTEAILFLGGEPSVVDGFSSFAEDPNKDWLQTYIVSAYLSGQHATLFARDWNKLAMNSINELGLGEFSPATLRLEKKMVTTPGPFGGEVALGYEIAPALINSAENAGPVYAIIFPEFHDRGKPKVSKNVLAQIERGIKTYTPVLVNIGAAVTIGGAAGALLGKGIVGTLAQKELTPKVMDLIAVKPNITSMPTIEFPQITALDFGDPSAEVAVEAAPMDLRDALNDPTRKATPIILIVLSVIILIKLISR